MEPTASPLTPAQLKMLQSGNGEGGGGGGGGGRLVHLESKMALLRAVAADVNALASGRMGKRLRTALLVGPRGFSNGAAYITRAFLAARAINSETLNDLSLEHFFNRVIEFVIALAILLARLGWPLALTSVIFARACTGE